MDDRKETPQVLQEEEREHLHWLLSHSRANFCCILRKSVSQGEILWQFYLT